MSQLYQLTKNAVILSYNKMTNIFLSMYFTAVFSVCLPLISAPPLSGGAAQAS